jgi:hypothetical protein
MMAKHPNKPNHSVRSPPHAGQHGAAPSVAYVDAKTPQELGDALAGISDQLASCVFTLGNAATGVDAIARTCS